MNNPYKISIVSSDAEIALGIREALISQEVYKVKHFKNLDFHFSENREEFDLLVIVVDNDNFLHFVSEQSLSIESPFILVSKSVPVYNMSNNLTPHLKGVIIWPFAQGQLHVTAQTIILQTKQEINLEEGRADFKVDMREFLYAKKEDHYLRLFFREKEELVRMTINEFLSRINTKSVIRTHRSYLVNAMHIAAVRYNSVKVEDFSVPMSRTYRHLLAAKS